jgi:23S rRNA (uracil1939-C5)-methyltransferase
MNKRSGKPGIPAWRKPRHRRKSGEAKGSVQELEISEIGHRGEGVAWIEQNGDKTRCYVPYTAAGDTVRARVSGDRGELIEIIAPGPDRKEPFCPHFGTCGGCALQHLESDTYTSWKQGVVETALERQGIEAPVHSIIDAHGTGRRRVSMHVKIANQEVRAGFMRAKSHELLPIELCPILSPELSHCFKIAGELGRALLGNCNAMDVQMATTSTGLDCNMAGPRDLNYDQHMDLTEIAHAENFARLSANDDIVLEQRPPVLRMGVADVTISPAAFLQATALGEESLWELVQNCVGDARVVADLFCGVGPFALRLAGRASVYAADNSEAAIAALRRAADHTSGLKPIETVRRDLFADPLTVLELNRFDAVVFDPPRVGAQKQVRELATSTVPVIAAVSCDAASFARDARTLVEGGYTLRHVTPVDQFKWSAHVEIVGCFVRD